MNRSSYVALVPRVSLSGLVQQYYFTTESFTLIEAYFLRSADSDSYVFDGPIELN